MSGVKGSLSSKKTERTFTPRHDIISTCTGVKAGLGRWVPFGNISLNQAFTPDTSTNDNVVGVKGGEMSL